MADKKEFKLNIPTGGVTAIPVLGKVVKTSKEGVYCVKEEAILGKQYKIICPICGKAVFVKATEPKKFFKRCQTCNTPIVMKGSESGEAHKDAGKAVVTSKNPVRGSKTNAKLSWWSLSGPKNFILRIGKNYVGRKDSMNPSDLSLKDEYASAKSICIDVIKSARGYTFHLTVEHATNPVLINGKEQPEGSSFDLNYGDILKLGNTTFTFKPVKK